MDLKLEDLKIIHKYNNNENLDEKEKERLDEIAIELAIEVIEQAINKKKE